MGCQAMVDMTFAMCVWASLVALLYGIKSGERGAERVGIHSLSRALFWFFASIAVLARGPLGLLLPVALAATGGCAVLGVKRTIALVWRPTYGWLALAIPGAWYIAAYTVGGEAFLERQLLFENLKRFSGGEFVNSEAWWFYLPSLLRTTFPWGIILLWIVITESRRGRSLSYPNERSLCRWIPVLLLSAGVFLFSLSSGKRHSYLLPLLPFVALQLGIEISSLLERGGVTVRQRLLNVARNVEVTLGGLAIAAFAGLSLCIATGLVTSDYFQDAYSAASQVLSRMGGVILGISLASFVVIRRSLNSVCASAWLMMLVVMTTMVSAGSSVKGYFKGFDAMSTTWLNTSGQGDELALLKHQFDEYFDPMLFYVRRPVRLVPLESGPSECRAATVYATKRAWLDAHEQLFSGSIVRVATVRERGSAYKGREDRDVVFFRCSTLGLPDESTKPVLQDANLRAPGGLQKHPSVVSNKG
jgi:4-amino-4-deoxy-L-arabinose transferase-like glycosyltransferase